MPATMIKNATISKIFNKKVVFDSGFTITKRKRIITPKIPVPSTTNVLFMRCSPPVFLISITFVIMHYNYNTYLFVLDR